MTIVRWVVFLVYIPIQKQCWLFTYLILRWKGATFRFYAHNMYRGPTLPPTAPRHPNRHRLRRGDQTKGTLGNLCKSASYSSVQNSEINFRQGSELYLQKSQWDAKAWFSLFSHFWPIIVFVLFDWIGCCIIKISNLLVQPKWLFQINGTIYISDVLCWKINAGSGNGQFNFFRTVAEWWLCSARGKAATLNSRLGKRQLSWWRTTWNLEVNTWHVWGSSQRALLGLSKVRWRVPLMLWLVFGRIRK